MSYYTTVRGGVRGHTVQGKKQQAVKSGKLVYKRVGEFHVW